MKIRASGIEFEYRVEGREGAPWMMFSNSLATNLALWDPQVAAFADRFRILRYDQRGHGGTDAPAAAYSFGQLTDDAAELLGALGIERVTFVGVSMGAITGLGLASKYPDRVEKVVLCDGPWGSEAAQAALWEERVAQVEREGMGAMVESTVTRWFRPKWIEGKPPELEKVRGMIRETAAAGYIGCARALQSFDYREAARGIAAPVLLIVGENDGVLPQVMHAMHEAMAGSRIVVIPDAGHLPNVEKPDLFNQALRAFAG